MLKKYLPLLMATALIFAGCSQGMQPKLTPQNIDKMAQEEPIITLYQHENAQVVEMPLEDYLLGVVAAEMDVNWPLEALKAQAIMARTFTLEKIASGGVTARGTDASTDIKEFQAYNQDNINDVVRQAIKETRGEVIKYHGQLIKAWFFADGGGITAASSAEGLSYDKTETPYIQSVQDPGIALDENPNKEWQASFSLAEVAKAIEAVNGRAPQSLEEAAVVEKGSSGRATWLQIGDASIGATSFRLAIGSEMMKSTLLTSFAIKDGQLIMTGKGYGHGVGMSQWGARAMAEQGYTAEDIIHYFLKDVEITTEYH